MSRIASLSNAVATWVGVLSAVTGGYMALDSYQEDTRKRVDERQQAAFAQVGTFLGRDFVPIRDKVRSYVQARWSCDGQPFQSFGLSETELSTYIEMFDMVEACRSAGLCDAATVERFFSPYARSGFPVLRDFVEATRTTNNALQLDVPFGSGFERLAGDDPKGPACGG